MKIQSRDDYNGVLFTLTDFTETPTDYLTFEFRRSAESQPGLCKDFRVKFRIFPGTVDRDVCYRDYCSNDIARIPFFVDTLKITEATKVTFRDGEQVRFLDGDALRAILSQWRDTPYERFVRGMTEGLLRRIHCFYQPTSPTLIQSPEESVIKEQKKYDLVKVRGKGFQIVALRDIPRHGITAGDRGGFVQNKDNLSQDGDCWISVDSKVINDARVKDNALINGSCSIEDKVEVKGDSLVQGICILRGRIVVSGNTKIRGSVYVDGTTVITGNTTIEGIVNIFGRGHISGTTYIKGGTHFDLFIGQNALLENSSDYMKIGPLTLINADLSAYRTQSGQLLYQLTPSQGNAQAVGKIYTAKELLAKAESRGERSQSVIDAVNFIEKTMSREP